MLLICNVNNMFEINDCDQNVHDLEIQTQNLLKFGKV